MEFNTHLYAMREQNISSQVVFTQPTIFDKLESKELNINEQEKYFLLYVVWDMEAMLKKIQTSTPTEDNKSSG